MKRMAFAVNVEKMYDLFLKEKEVMLDRSPKTMRYLRQASRYFLPTIGPATNEGELRKLTLEAVGKILDLPVRGRSKNTYLGPLKNFLNWLVEQEVLSKAIRIKKVKVEKKLRETLTAEQVLSLLSYKCQLKSLNLRRIQTACALMLDSGLRSAEVRMLKVADIDLAKMFVKVYGKNRTERLVPFGPECRIFLMRWLMQLPDSTVWAFPTKTGRPLGERNALRDLQNLAKRCQIWHVTLHGLRHTFATTWCRRGGNLEILRRCTGHSDIRVTMEYLHNSVSDLQAVHDQFSPLAGMKMKA